MFSISLSNLETARNNASQYAQILKNGKPGGGGNGSFIQCWKDVIKECHSNSLGYSDAYKLLEQKLSNFKNTEENNIRRGIYLNTLDSYLKEFKNLDLGIDRYRVNVKWPIVSNSMLTGHSPLLVSNSITNYGFFFAENKSSWETELKFPLLQIYLSEKFFECDINNVQVGVYCLSTKSFHLKSFEDFELDNALEEAKKVFRNVKAAYDKL